jgi:putative addiction module component (TIGR02574 family)
MHAEDVLPQALELSRDERSRLAALLLDSLEASGTDGDVEQAWVDETTRRLDEHEHGTTPAIAADAVFAEARSRLKHARG